MQIVVIFMMLLMVSIVGVSLLASCTLKSAPRPSSTSPIRPGLSRNRW